MANDLKSLQKLKEPYVIYCALSTEVCEACFSLDRRNFEKEEALKIEADHPCGCEHNWIGFPLPGLDREDDLTVARRELGITPSLRPCRSLCAPELYALALEYLELHKAFLAENQRLNDQFKGKHSPNNFLLDDIAKFPDVPYNDDPAYVSARKKATRAKTAVNNYVKNYVRDKEGKPHVGEKWVNETALYRLVESLFPGDKVIHHHRDEWLGTLELDVYVVGANIGFEYHGIQHFEPQEHWGGEEALIRTKERDAEKRQRCADNGTRLIEVLYTEEITEELIRQKLAEE